MIDPNDNNDIDEIRRDIEDTRQRISVEIEALEGKLTPAHAKEVMTEKVKESIVETKDRFVGKIGGSAAMVRDGASRMGTDIVSTARANPIPLALIGVGAGWLAWELIRPRRDVEIEVEPLFELEGDTSIPGGTFTESETYTSYVADDVSVGGALGESPYGYTGAHSEGIPSSRSYGDLASSKLDGAKSKLHDATSNVASRARNVKDRAVHAFSDARGRASSVASDARGRASHLSHDARERASALAVRGKENVRHGAELTNEAYSANPLAFGALALAAGVGVAMLLPKTQREDQIFGEAHRKIADRARTLAEGAKTVAIDAVKEGAQAVKQTAKREIDEGKLGQR